MHFTKLAYQKQIRTLQENYSPISLTMASQMALVVKEPICQCRRHKRHSVDPGWEDPLEGDMATPSPILAREFHGQRVLAGYPPEGRRESGTT